MEFLIVRGLSSVLEASLWTYFIISLAKILNKEEIKFSKVQIISFFMSLVVLFEIRISHKRHISFF